VRSDRIRMDVQADLLTVQSLHRSRLGRMDRGFDDNHTSKLYERTHFLIALAPTSCCCGGSATLLRLRARKAFVQPASRSSMPAAI
jgi:hypothetical protein